MPPKNYFVYIATNFTNTVFYTGITNNLNRRMYEHKNQLVKGFTSKYNVNKLVYYELFTDINDAISREKQIKDYRREKKLGLIRLKNASFEDIIC